MKKNQRVPLYKDEDFANLTQVLEYEEGSEHDTQTALRIEEVSDFENIKIIVKAEDNVINLIKENEKGFSHFAILDTKKAENYEVFYQDEKFNRHKDIEVETFAGNWENPPEFEYFESKDADDLVKEYKDIVKELNENSSGKSVGEALIVDSSNEKFLNKALNKFDKDFIEHTTVYKKEGFDPVYQQKIGDRSVLFTENGGNPSLLNEIEKGMEKEYKKGQNLRP